jgi:hypothetical protein
MIAVRFYSLTGKFAPVREEQFATVADARVAVEAHAASGGYTNVKPVEDADSIRWTARTPGGRGGRNIAYSDYTY